VAVLTSTKTTVIPHPPYSPDLAPCDFSLFSKMKVKLKGRHFESIEEIQAESQDVMKMLMQNDFQQCFRSWKSRWDRCINAEGDYFEGDGSEFLEPLGSTSYTALWGTHLAVSPLTFLQEYGKVKLPLFLIENCIIKTCEGMEE
jgi:hypothetical protein